jgi:hypothetical protein
MDSAERNGSRAIQPQTKHQLPPLQ